MNMLGRRIPEKVGADARVPECGALDGAERSIFMAIFSKRAETAEELGPKKETMQSGEVSFGEKVKQRREEKGLTQQALAEKLYVTRQAVSRWECGARQPDLLTAKKLSKILEISLDELLSGEKFREDIEREPVSVRPVEHMIQTALYAGVSVTWLLLCLFSVYAAGPGRAPSNTPAGRITPVSVGADLVRVLCFAAALSGLLLSLRNKLTAKVTGYLMSIPCLSEALLFLITYTDMKIKDNGYIGFDGWMTEFILPVVFAGCIVLYFWQKEQKIPFGVIMGICVVVLGTLLYGYRNKFRYFTDVGFASTTVSMAGKLGMAALLGYQAYLWKKRRKAGISFPAPDSVDQAFRVQPPV